MNNDLNELNKIILQTNNQIDQQTIYKTSKIALNHVNDPVFITELIDYLKSELNRV